MSTPGWYPDPAGIPGRFRYWDGVSWSSVTTTDPAATRPPTPVAAVAPQRGGRGPVVALLVGLLALALLVWALFFRGDDGFRAVPADTNSASPTGPVWNETSPPTPEPSGVSEPAPTGGAMVSCPTEGGSLAMLGGDRLHGGGLSVPLLPGWGDGADQAFSLPWTHGLQAQTKVIHQSLGTSWFSVQALGSLSVADGFDEPRNSARMMMSCFATSGYYSGFAGRKDLVTEKVEVGGRPGWHLRSEVYVDMPVLPEVAGDVIDVVVVDTGRPESLGVFVSSATIGDEQTQQEVDSSREAIQLG